MPEPVNPYVLNLLLLSGDRGWTDAVRSAAIARGADGLDVTHSAHEAMRRLSMPGQSYSHLLLDSAFAGEFGDDLVGMTSGEENSRTGLVMLGSIGGAPAHVPVVAEASFERVSAALGPPWRARRPASAAQPIRSEDLRAALAGALIQTRYQPVVRIHDRAPVTVEVLARLNHPQYGLVGPDRFVPLIEDAGLAEQLTERVVTQALADMGAPAIAARRLMIALNFPLDVLLVPDAIAVLDARREAAGMEAERITIEMTESRPVSDLPRLRRVLERLRHAGYRVAIDDVGPAVAHHRALIDLPFTAMKLDMDVVHLSLDSPASLDFIGRMVEAAHARGLTVIAEGVQSQAIWDRMASLGVDHAQGFLVGRPLPAAALPFWLENWA